MGPLATVFRFILQIGYFGPLAMGVLDSPFLVLLFGNDLLVVGLVVHNHHGCSGVFCGPRSARP